MKKCKARFNIRRIFVILLLMILVSPVVFITYRASKRIYASIKYHVEQRFFTCQAITYQFNHIFSNAIKNDIQVLLDQEFANGNLLRFNQGDFYSDIKDKFNLIKSISYRYVPSKTVLVTIEGVTPMFMVNHTFVVGENRQLYEGTMFENFPTSTLPLIMVNQRYASSHLDQEVYELLCSLNSNFWQNFTLNYQGPHEIIIRQKQSSKNLKIITDHESLFDQEKFAQINTIQQNLISTKKLPETQNYELVFDLRFKKRIVTKIVDLGRRGRKK